jgi:hypothetical protein
MSAWRNASQWRPRQFGIAMPAELVPFLAWIAPAALGALLLLAALSATGHLPPAPERLDQLGISGSALPWTLVWSPIWSLPVVIAMLALRLALLLTGRFGWASALVAGAIAGTAAPLFLGTNFWLIGPLYGAITLWMQQAIYRAIAGNAFDA